MTYPDVTALHDPSSGIVAPSSWGDDVNAALVALNTVRIPLFPELGPGRVPETTQGMAYAWVASTAGGSDDPEFPTLLADSATDEGRMWVLKPDDGITTNLVLKGRAYTKSANTDKDIVIEVSVSVYGNGDGSVEAQDFGSVNTATIRMPNSADELEDFSVTLSNADSFASGDMIVVLVRRLASSDAADNLTSGDVAIVGLWLEGDRS